MKKLLIGLVVLVLLVVVAAIALPFFIPVESYKPKIADAVKTATGRDFAINGKISLSVLPSLQIEANDVTFGNAPGAATKDMAKLAKLQIGVQLFPLLSGRIAIDNFVLVQPVISLEVDKQGHPNWEIGGAKKEAAAPQPAASGSSASVKSQGLEDIQLGDVRLDNGIVSYQDDRSGEKYTISNINMKISLPDLDHKFEASGKATYNGKDISLDTQVANPRVAMGGKPTDFKLTVGGEMLKLDIAGSIAMGPPLKVNGTVDFSIPSIRNLASWAGKPLPASGGPLGPLSITGKLALDDKKASFTDAKVSIDAIKGTGELAVNAGGAKPAIKAKLALDKLDVNPYLPPDPPPGAAPAASPAAASAGQKGWSTDPIDFSGLNAADADLALSFASLTFKKFEIGKGALTLALHDAHLDVELTQLELYSGNGVGKVVVDGKGTPAIQSAFKLDKVQLNPLVKAAGVGDWISGTANMDFDVNTTGRSQKDFVSALGGKGGLSVNSGSISGIDIGALISNPVKAIEEQATKTGKTDFASLTGTYTIASGIVKNTDLAMTSPIFQLAGTGIVSLPPQTVDYKIEPKLSAGSKGPGLSIPVKVVGPWNNLSYQPDLAGTLADPNKAVDTVKGLIGGNKDGTKTKPADVLKGLLGGH